MTANTTMNRIPPKLDKGRHCESDISYLIHQFQRHTSGKGQGYTADAQRFACGLPIPYFQRELCWNAEQEVKFIESIWLGLPLGSYVLHNLDWDMDGNPSPFSGLAIDGQQRISTVQNYLEDRFKVFGLLYSELTKRERHRFENVKFTHYEVDLNDWDDIIDLYNRLAFGGTPHKETERAK